MKRCIFFCLLCLLLTGCAGGTGTAESAIDEQRLLVGVWRNQGQYSEGHDFVETMTLAEDGACTVHLEYQGQDYETLTGTYTVSDGMLYTTFDRDGGALSRDFHYSLEGDTLTLKTDSKTVTYEKIN